MQDSEVMRAEMLALSERNLRSVVVKSEPDNADDKKIWYRANEYISGTLGKAFYSTRQELTGADGRRLFTNDTRATANLPLNNLFKGVKAPEHVSDTPSK